MNGRTARANFKHFLASLRDRIEGEFRGPGITIPKKIKVRATDTAGWSARVLYASDSGIRLECWYDQFMEEGTYSLAAVLSAKSKAMITYFSSLSIDIRAENLISDDTVEINSAGTTYYSGSQKKKRFTKLYGEHYQSDKMYAGRYFFNIPNIRKSALADEVMGFLTVLLSGLSNSRDDHRAYTKVKAKEGRKKVVRHLRRERDGKAPREAKKRDGYQCKVCDLRFTDQYGDYGKEFAEAHHIVALASHKGEHDITEKSFITVCSNCHRMLHKMEGKSKDWSTLRAIVQKHKNAP